MRLRGCCCVARDHGLLCVASTGWKDPAVVRLSGAAPVVWMAVRGVPTVASAIVCSSSALAASVLHHDGIPGRRLYVITISPHSVHVNNAASHRNGHTVIIRGVGGL